MVYGSFIGASLTVILFVVRHKLPLLAVVDLLGPSLMLGLAFGRIGCFMNGCCWGGACDQSSLGVTFPQGSPPFVDQINNGSLLGMTFEEHPDDTYTILKVEPGGLGEEAGLQAGDTIRHLVLPTESEFNRLRHGESADDALLSLAMANGRRIRWTLGELPKRSAPVYPVQLFSSLNAALLCLFLWAYYPLRKRDGEVAALLMTIYPTSRILLEAIRTDESPVFQFALGTWQMAPTISQTISGVILLAVAALWIYLWRQPRRLALPQPT